MTAAVDPNAPKRHAGESAANFAYRLQQYRPPTSGPNQGAAKQWLGAHVTVPKAPTGWTIK